MQKVSQTHYTDIMGTHCMSITSFVVKSLQYPYLAEWPGLSASPSIVNGVSAALQKLNCYVHIQSTQIKKTSRNDNVLAL